MALSTTLIERIRPMIPNKIQQAAATHAQAMIDHEYDYQKNHNPLSYENISQKQKDQWEKRIHDKSRKLADEIEGRKPDFIRRSQQGLLHPDNKHSRRLFSAVTGLRLPPTVQGTSEIVQEYARAEFVATGGPKATFCKKWSRSIPLRRES